MADDIMTATDVAATELSGALAALDPATSSLAAQIATASGDLSSAITSARGRLATVEGAIISIATRASAANLDQTTAAQLAILEAERNRLGSLLAIAARVLLVLP